MKSPMQTAFEKMSAEELQVLFEFVTNREKGAAGRLCLIEGALEFEQRQRGMIPKPKGINLMTHPEEGKAAMVLNIRSNQAAHVALCKGAKNAVVKLDDPAFISAARAHFGVNEFYGDEAMRAARELDEQFFKSALSAIQTLKARQRKQKQRGGESLMLLHIQAALTFLHEGDRKGAIPQRKITKQKLITELGLRLGAKVFAAKSDSWPKFFERSEIKPFVTQARSGGRPKTSGKGRAVDSFDHHPDGKQPGGK